MSDETHAWQMVEYEGFEIHTSPRPKQPDESRFTYIGYVCHPGADPALPGHVVPFHADGEESFASLADGFTKPCTRGAVSSTARIRTCRCLRS